MLCYYLYIPLLYSVLILHVLYSFQSCISFMYHIDVLILLGYEPCTSDVHSFGSRATDGSFVYIMYIWDLGHLLYVMSFSLLLRYRYILYFTYLYSVVLKYLYYEWLWYTLSWPSFIDLSFILYTACIPCWCMFEYIMQDFPVIYVYLISFMYHISALVCLL